MAHSISSDPDLAKAGAVHAAALDAVQGAMSALSDVKFVSRPVDRDGNVIQSEEDRLEEAHRQRVLAGTARASGSLLITVQAELNNLGVELGQLRAQYLLDERMLLARIEQVAARLALAKELSK